MKALQLILISLFICTLSIQAQIDLNNCWKYSFDHNNCMKNINYNTVFDSSNTWQIGTPNKTVFTSAFLGSKVIATDTIHTYPTSDTSSFTITYLAWEGLAWPHTAYIEGEYYVNTDSLNDFGLIEFSPDNGITWINLLKDSTILATSSQYNMQLPTLTGNTNGWQHFFIDLHDLAWQLSISIGDTVQYKFTFISDSIQDSLDGIMFDEILVADISEDIEESKHENIISIYPNPVSDILRIEHTYKKEKIDIIIYNQQGQIVKKFQNINPNYIKVEDLKNGIYFIKFQSKKENILKKFVVIN